MPSGLEWTLQSRGRTGSGETWGRLSELTGREPPPIAATEAGSLHPPLEEAVPVIVKEGAVEAAEATVEAMIWTEAAAEVVVAAAEATRAEGAIEARTADMTVSKAVAAAEAASGKNTGSRAKTTLTLNNIKLLVFFSLHLQFY